jgi:hypothetical protein
MICDLLKVIAEKKRSTTGLLQRGRDYLCGSILDGDRSDGRRAKIPEGSDCGFAARDRRINWRMGVGNFVNETHVLRHAWCRIEIVGEAPRGCVSITT